MGRDTLPSSGKARTTPSLQCKTGTARFQFLRPWPASGPVQCCGSSWHAAANSVEARTHL